MGMGETITINSLRPGMRVYRQWDDRCFKVTHTEITGLGYQRVYGIADNCLFGQMIGNHEDDTFLLLDNFIT